jgi:DNA polymerase III epsilon subunit-like protein
MKYNFIFQKWLNILRLSNPIFFKRVDENTKLTHFRLMKLLFLDTETTGLSPTNGQVIELGAILASLDTATLVVQIESRFEELVALRSQMDDKITRITGISTEELLPAPPIHKIQEKWYNFLQDCPEDIMIIGHSLQFDIDFLKSEGWFLPEKYVFCDSLEISKILLPDCNAVNLEFLIEKLSLEPSKSQLYKLGITDKSLLKPHRAFYDTIACLNLCQTLFNILINSNFDQKIYDIIMRDFLPIKASFFTHQKQEEDFQISKDTYSTELPIYLNGEIIEPSLFEKINQPFEASFLTKLINYTQLKLPRVQLQLLLQIYVISIKKRSTKNENLKIHTKDNTEFLFVDQIYNSLNQDKINTTKSLSTGVISPIEGIINQIKYISEHNYKITEFINLLEIYYDITILDRPDSQFLKQIQEITNCYDFLLLNLQPFWQKSEYYYTPNQLKPEEEVVKRKLTELYHLFDRFEPNELVINNDINNQLVQSIQKLHRSFFDNEGNLQIAPSKRLLFRNQGMQVFISTFVYQFSLSQVLENTFNQFQKIILETYLKEADFNSLMILTGTKELINKFGPKIEIRYLANPNRVINFIDNKQNIKLSDFLANRKVVSDTENKFSLLLCGQNSGLKEIEREFTSEFQPADYLVLGESGSLTKIVSKMIKNQKGMIAVKNGDFYYISRYLDSIELAEIWIINQPYFPIHKYWQTLALNSTNKDEYTNALKWLYLKSQAGFISTKTNMDINFLKSYRV